jgi:hypothetical protein
MEHVPEKFALCSLVKGGKIMPEVIIELGDALYNEETGEAVFKPKIVSRLCRCKDCGWFAPMKRCRITDSADGISTMYTQTIIVR